MNSATIAAEPSPDTNAKPVLQEKGARGLIAVAALAALADWLFFRRAVGISLMIFLVALIVAAALNNPFRARGRHLLLAGGLLVAAFAPLVVALNAISLLFALAGTAYFVVAMTWPDLDLRARLLHAGAMFVDALWRAPADIHHEGRAALGDRYSAFHPRVLTAWVVPLVLGGIFVVLFAAANPMIERWFDAIDLPAILARLSLARIGFWLLVILLVWPFVFMRCRAWLRSWEASPPRIEAVLPEGGVPSALFGAAAILRSLVLFNLLFAVQSVLDALYLWGGAALPDGMTYAAYAHRGAYPLIVTALLAAFFIVVATRPGSDAERSRPIRILVFLWTAQNVQLVVSSILRLDLYVEIYSLTWWRVAAFIWMLLVAVGLVLIVARLALRRSNAWLISANLITLVVTLYACGFVNFPSVIANYNVTHSRQVNGTGSILDMYYLRSLGPQAIPAIDRFVEKTTWPVPQDLVFFRQGLVTMHLDRVKDWRAWSLRNWQLDRYLAAFDAAAASRAAAAPAGTRP